MWKPVWMKPARAQPRADNSLEKIHLICKVYNNFNYIDREWLALKVVHKNFYKFIKIEER